MKPKTAQEKGNKFERFIVDLFKQLDNQTYRIFGSGAGIQKGDVYCPNLQWIIEAKNHKHLSIINWYEQLKRQGNDANISILAFKHPKSPDANPEVLITMSFDDLVRLTEEKSIIKREIKTDNRELKYATDSLAVVAKKVLKLLNKE